MDKENMLKELTEVRVEKLNSNTKLLFETIMEEFDKRDNYKQALNEIRETLKKHKNDLDYEPWSIYKIEGEVLFNILQIIDKVLGDDKK